MRRLLTLTVALLGIASVASAQPTGVSETPYFAAQVQAGRLPAVADRLPDEPSIAEFAGRGTREGRHGGELHLLMGRSQDVRMMVVYGYARLVGYDSSFNLVPDILRGVDVERQRVFTLHLRPGHRWSDGHLLTANDFKYWWDDIIGNREITRSGPPTTMLVDGKPPVFQVLDQFTVRFTWDGPNPYFLPALAGASPLYIYRPAHYLKQFHQAYADPALLADAVRRANVRNWVQLHNRMDNQYRNDNPDLPTLDPWVNTTRPPAERFVFVRNPYYHRIDSAGRQLPYIDRVVMNIAATSVMPAKVGAGESDLQSRGLVFNDYAFLKKASKRGNFDVHLWDTARGAQVALYPNLNASDPVWRQLNRDVRFRRALSLAIDRTEINKVAYYGLAIEGNNTLLPGSPLHRPEDRQKWAQFDLAAANRLLDEIGLTKRDRQGIRLMPDGRPIEIVAETAGEDTEQTDVLALIHDTWLKIGVKLFSRPSQRDVLRRRSFAGQTVMAVWSGIENGLVTAGMSPDEFAPTTQQQLQWPKWGQHIETKGASGEACDEPEALELQRLNDAWRLAGTLEERTRIWRRMIEINTEQVYSIGIVAGVKQPVVASRDLRNLPQTGIYNWDPGAFFGIYRPDTFWRGGSAGTAEAR
ncbi:MAG: ABC transporter substrate-binding protein [Alphaproteobacteria bacterium]|nr:ABC transporter substrate-binding protein [Alphaproteobacteria bacterium]